MTKALQELELELEMEGYRPGTPAYDRLLRFRKWSKCLQLRGHMACSECDYEDHCELSKAVARDKVGAGGP